ncbi:MAG: hypothetical protein Q9M25_07315 [Mariprofundaceae bacterium]|nr:hypothetical protein [Mariprofundaceae bacterium]
MPSLSFFRHHTGRMASAARWYLATMGMLSLLLLSGHFAVQEHVQKKMRTAVHGWLAETGGSVAHVRYRLLRGELTLEKLHIETAQIRLDAPLVFLHTSNQSMFASTPFFTLMHFEHPRLELPRKVLSDWLLADKKNHLQTWSRLLPHVGSMSVADMHMHIGGTETGDAVTLQQMDGRWDGDGLLLNGMLDAGLLQLKGQVDNDGLVDAQMLMQGVPLAAISVLGYDGASTGSGELHISGNWRRREINTQGELHIQQAEDMALLRIDGVSTPAAISWHIQSSHAQLGGWSSALPNIAGRSLVAGVLDGEIRLQCDAQQTVWRLGVDGELSGVRMIGEGLPAWEIALLHITNGVVDAPNNRFSIARLSVEDADVGLNVFAGDSDTVADDMLNVDKLELKNVRPQLFFADASVLDLPAMQGSGSLSSQQDRLELRGGAEAAKKSARSDKGKHERWVVSAAGDFSGAYTADVKARGVPLVRLRPLLPDLALPGERGVPEYAGSSDFSLSLTAADGKIAAQGRAVLHDVLMTQGGDSLGAAFIEADIAVADTAGMRRLKQVTIKDWQYQSALHPLLRRAGDVAEEIDSEMQAPLQDVVEISPPTDVAQMPSAIPLTWSIDKFMATEGRISLGRRDALIADKLSFSLRHLDYGLASAFTLRGRFSEGSLHMQGRLLLQPDVRITGKAKMTNILPFAFNDWMQVSAMPRFVRGRLDASLRLSNDAKDDDAYRGKLDVSLYQGQLESGSFPDDPLLERGGYAAQALLDRLNHSHKATISFPFRGRWRDGALLAHIGETGLAALKQTAQRTLLQRNATSSTVSSVTRIRLQGKHGFSHNERVRLRHLIQRLKKQPALIAELVPQLGHAPLGDDMSARVRRSQRMIEKYLHRFGIARKRIYPVWPLAVNQQGDAPGIIIRVRSL